MKFLCDAHISFKLIKWLNEEGFEAIHVNTILDSYYTTDERIAAYADMHGLILVSKDSDFKNQHLLNKSPKQLVKISSGNTSNERLIDLIRRHIKVIEKLSLKSYFLLEIGAENTTMITLD